MEKEAKKNLKKQKKLESKKLKKQKKLNLSLVLGILLIALGTYLLSVEIFPSLAQLNNLLLLFAGIYFIICSFYFNLNRIYLFVGLVLTTIWASSLLSIYIQGGILIWSVILFFSGLLVLGVTVRIHKNKEQSVLKSRVFYISIALILFAIFLLLSSFNIFSFELIWPILRAIIIVLIGVSIIHRRMAPKSREDKTLRAEKVEENDDDEAEEEEEESEEEQEEIVKEVKKAKKTTTKKPSPKKEPAKASPSKAKK